MFFLFFFDFVCLVVSDLWNAFYYMENDRKTKRERDNGLLGVVIVVIVVRATLFWKKPLVVLVGSKGFHMFIYMCKM